MFTLKIAHTGSNEGSATWISGVKTVHLIDISTRSESLAKWEWCRTRDDLVDHTAWLGDDSDVALLSVESSDGRVFYYIVGRAWLLGPDGGTIERITP